MIKSKVKKAYRAKLDGGFTRIVGWPRFSHAPEKKTVWQAIRAMLF